MSTARPALAVYCLALALAITPLGAETSLGEGVEIEEATPIGRILADPDEYIGQAVRIEGGALDVCPMKGCWIELGDEGESLRVKVDDGVIVFPADAKGHLVAAQGVVEAVEMERDAYIGWLRHLAEEKGEPFDADALELGPGPFRRIQLRGTGAVVDGP